MKEIFEFGQFRLDVDDHAVVCVDGSIMGALNEKSFQVLVLLVRRHGHLVTRDELIHFAWPDTIVEDNNLEKCVHRLRQFLGDTTGDSKYIETVRKHGYRFVGHVQKIVVSGSWLAVSYEIGDNDKTWHEAGKTSFARPDATLAPANEQNGSDATGASIAEPIDEYRDEVTTGSVSAEAKAIGHGPAEAEDPAELTKRGVGLRRGLKACFAGIAVGFVFVVLFQMVRIGHLLVIQYEGSLPPDTSDPLSETAWGLITLVSIPVELGIFLGLGLLLFGIVRLAWALFETDERKVSPNLAERAIAVFVVLALLSIAVPNLMYSYRVARKARDIKESRSR